MTTDTTDTGPVARFVHLVVGAVAGLVATVVMSTFRVSIARSLPPTEEFLEQFVPGVADADAPSSFGLHLSYGAAAGALFGAVLGPHVRGREVNRERVGAALGTLYGIVLSVLGRWVLVEGLLDLDLDPDERFVFHAGHAVYGLTLGTWFGAYDRPQAVFGRSDDSEST